jgi:hypothetical protein
MYSEELVEVPGVEEEDGGISAGVEVEEFGVVNKEACEDVWGINERVDMGRKEEEPGPIEIGVRDWEELKYVPFRC